MPTAAHGRQKRKQGPAGGPGASEEMCLVCLVDKFVCFALGRHVFVLPSGEMGAFCYVWKYVCYALWGNVFVSFCEGQAKKTKEISKKAKKKTWSGPAPLGALTKGNKQFSTSHKTTSFPQVKKQAVFHKSQNKQFSTSHKSTSFPQVTKQTHFP